MNKKNYLRFAAAAGVIGVLAGAYFLYPETEEPTVTPSSTPSADTSTPPVGSGQAPTPTPPSQIPQTVTPGPSSSRYVRVITPNKGERLCLGEDYLVQWEAGGVQTVGVYLHERSGKTIKIENAPGVTRGVSQQAGIGAFVWKVGVSGEAKESSQYEIIVAANDGGAPASDTSNNVFSIANCQ